MINKPPIVSRCFRLQIEKVYGLCILAFAGQHRLQAFLVFLALCYRPERFEYECRVVCGWLEVS